MGYHFNSENIIKNFYRWTQDVTIMDLLQIVSHIAKFPFELLTTY